jgi:hypothetical protein
MIAGMIAVIAGTIAGIAETTGLITGKSGRAIATVWTEGRKTLARTGDPIPTTPAIIGMATAIIARDSVEATSSDSASTPTTADGKRLSVFRKWRTEN